MVRVIVSYSDGRYSMSRVPDDVTGESVTEVHADIWAWWESLQQQDSSMQNYIRDCVDPMNKAT